MLVQWFCCRGSTVSPSV